MSAPLSPTSLPAKPPISSTKDTQSSGTSQPDTESESPHTEESREAGEYEKAQDLKLEQPPLPSELPPPLPTEQPSAGADLPKDDGWQPVWDAGAQAYYFYNRFTQASQWENPRVIEASSSVASVRDTGPPGASTASLPRKPVAGRYDPAIHGDYDPNADYAKVDQEQDDLQNAEAGSGAGSADPVTVYAATGHFNRFTGKWQSAEINPEKFNDENKSKRQMNAFFDVDAAANVHNGKSLKAERSGKRLSKQELKTFKEKRREKKEEKRRAWLRD